jgi:hypothetical protein
MTTQDKFLVFSNPGEIDPRAATILGVNVKEGPSPIGFFGTGLKNAIAVTLRLGGSIEILSGLTTFRFHGEEETIRGKLFQLIYMTTESVNAPQSCVHLGFTTDLGKAWLPWMAYRELWCNAKDEGGSVTLAPNRPQPQAGYTYIIVQGEAMLAAYRDRAKYVLQSMPLASTPYANIHPGNSKTVFYRGIAVCELPKPSLYTYNIQADCQLTEDRTLDSFTCRARIINALATCQDEALLRNALQASEATLEHGLDFSWHYGATSKEFVTTTETLYHTRLAKTSQSAIALARPQFLRPTWTEVGLTKVEEKMLAKALAFLKAFGHEVKEPIKIIETLGSQWTLGLAKDKTIFLPKSLFGKGTKYLASTLLEEHLHIAQDLPDCSRAMQDWLFDRVLSLAEELSGEPL